MRDFVTAILCFALTSFASAQTSSTSTPHSSTTSAQHARTEASAQKPPAITKAIIETTDGNINCVLFPDKAPLTVKNFIGLSNGTKDWTNPVSKAKKHGVPLYDGTIFHRVIPNFMIQGGDPAGNGMGDPGYSFKDEISPDLKFDQPGRLAMANSGPSTNGSQFFITEVPTPWLDGKHTIFGQCEDLDIVKKIARVAADPRNDKPFEPVKIIHIKIIQPGHAATTTHKPGTGTTTHKPATTTPKTTTPKKSTPPPSQ
jgi:cyclophilin family peptidyl-prolyl cis-trans isomerase